MKLNVGLETSASSCTTGLHAEQRVLARWDWMGETSVQRSF